MSHITPELQRELIGLSHRELLAVHQVTGHEIARRCVAVESCARCGLCDGGFKETARISGK